MKARPLCQSVLGPALVCVMLAACQTSPPATPEPELESQGRLSRPAPKPAVPGEAGVPTPTEGAPLAPQIPSLGEDGKWQHEAAVSAEAGGVLVSPDGFMKLQIPPGALDRDTVVRMNWFDTSEMTVTGENGAVGDPGISGQVDLGGARIKDGAQIMVTAPVDPRFVARVKMDDGGYDPNKYGLTQNDQGVWSMTMPIKGANPNPEPDDADANANPLAWEFNVQALPVQADEVVDPAKLTGEGGKYKIQCTFTTIDWTNPKIKEMNSLEGRFPSKFDCYTPPKNGDGSHTLHCFICAAVYGNQSKCEAIKTCFGSANLDDAGCQPATPAPTPPPPEKCQVRGKVTWKSDDAQLDGKPAGQHAYLRFEGVSGGGTEDKALGSANGEAGKNYEEGTKVRLTPYATKPAIVGSAKTITLSCPSGTENFTLTKNMPLVYFVGQGQGVKNADLKVTTNKGTHTGTGLTFSSKVSVYPEPEGATVSAYNSNYQAGGAWVDINPSGGGVFAKWNSQHVLYYKAWFSSKAKAEFSYLSNDATVPADQRPTIKWNGEPATNLNITFAHDVSSAAGKPAGRDKLSFTDHPTANAEAWGLNRADGTVTGKRELNGLTASGLATYKVGDTVVVKVKAELPKLKLKIKGDLPTTGQSPFVLHYKVKRQDEGTFVDKQMTLPQPGADGFVTVSIPIEEAVGQLAKHDFEIRGIYTADEWLNVLAPDGGWASTRKVTFRNGEISYPEFMAISTAPKYKTR